MPIPKPLQPSNGLPPNEKTFSISVEGDTTKMLSTGQFTCRCVLNLAQRSEADLVEARLNQGLKDVRPSTQTLHYVLAQLYVRLAKAPNWWVSSFLPDEGVPGKLLMDWNVVSAIFKECMDAEADWRIQVWGPQKPPEGPAEASEASSEEGSTPKV